MSTRTRSFFEEDHPAKTKSFNWSRQYTNKTVLSERNPNTTPSKPPIPATPQAKTKLKAFKFIPGQPQEVNEPAHEDGKENSLNDRDLEKMHTHSDLSRTASTAPEQPPIPADAETCGITAATKTPKLPQSNTFPCTPGTWLPLEDLIGNFDEAARRPEQKHRSPEEEIGWIPNSSSTLLTPNRKRKRARSSSPSCPNVSSQRQETSAFFAGNGTLMEHKSPEGDPAADLWQRYAPTGKQNPSFKLPDLSDVVLQPSPRPAETPMKSAGLRRWASTGNDWPTGKIKRQRTNGRSSIVLWQNQSETESLAQSKVAAMVEKVQQCLATQKLAAHINSEVIADGPSSSTPLPETGSNALATVRNPSPLRTRQQQPVPSGSAVAQRTPLQAPSAARKVQQLTPDNSGGGRTTMQSNRPILDQVAPAPLHLQTNAPLPAFKPPSMTRTTSSVGRHYPVKSQPICAPPLVALDDLEELGDAFDLSAEDLDELVSQPPIQQQSFHDKIQRVDASQQQATPRCALRQANNGQVAPKGVVETFVVIDDDDEFGCDDIDEASFAQAETSATQALRISPSKRSLRRSLSPRKLRISPKATSKSPLETGPMTLQRFKVKQIVEGKYTNAKGWHCPEQLLLADGERTLKSTAITLRDSWTTTSVSPGDIVHVANLGQANGDREACSTPLGQIIINDAEASQMLIVHPDHMLSATTVADSFDCIRKAVLQDRIKATGGTSKSMVYGKILHEVFQQALSANRWDYEFLAAVVEKTVQSHLEGLWELGMKDTNLAVEEVTAKMGEMTAWARVFVAAEPSDASLVDDKQGESVWMSVSKLIAIEEHVWSPRYGLKGNIDATIQSTLIENLGGPLKKLIAPFEVKTGRTTQSSAHRAQTALYTLLLSDRYDVSVKAGILYYLESSAMSRIAPPVVEMRQMVQQRNRLAAYIHRARHPQIDGDQTERAKQTSDVEESGLPSMLKNSFKCSRCYAQQSCFSYHALVEGGTAGSAGMVDDGKKNHSLVWHEAVGHLAQSARNKSEADALKRWFTKWDRLLTFEESELYRLRPELWTMSSAEREAAGRCFGNLVIEQDLTSTSAAVTSTVVDETEGSGGRINKFAYKFRRAVHKAGSSFAEGSQLTAGEPVVVSSEQGQWALAHGYVIALTRHDVTVAVDRRLGDARHRLDEFDECHNQAFRGIMTVGSRTEDCAKASPQVHYRLDKDEFSNGLALVRNNLVNLMSSHPIHTKLRSQLVFSATPSFRTASQVPSLPRSQLGDMNEDQRAAVSKTLSAQDYALILGMPGTGKTTTIAHIIQALLAEEKSILLTSFTHTAVDNILLKIRDITPPDSILRLGVPAKINREVQNFCQLAATPRKTVDEVEAAYMGCRIVATTCMGTNHALFSRRAFDVCIVDEASQITLPTSLGPLLHARKFVLVGDHYQLPPLVQNRSALQGGLDVSLFRQLSEEHPDAVATLGKQYRMCEDVMTLSNVLIYNGNLHCGNADVAERTLQCRYSDGLAAFHKASASPGALRCIKTSNCWLARLTAPEAKVLFANTDQMGKGATETLTSGKNMTNQVEATLTAQLVLAFLSKGVPANEIGVITFYRSQLALLRQLFKAAGVTTEVEIDSADRFQGRDKECIILSMVRSNKEGIVGDLLKDWRRVNVAITRARSKFIILGSRQTLRNNELLARLLALVDERGWTFDLPRAADACHDFHFGSQPKASLVAQTTSSPSKKLFGSPSKSAVSLSPQATPSRNPAGTLQPSWSAGNQNVESASQTKRVKGAAKVIKGIGTFGGRKTKKKKEQTVVEIFEDLTADDL